MDAAAPPTEERPVVLVTGASSGIGRAVAIEFARRRDARLVLAARRLDELHATASAADAPDATIVACDLATPEGIDELVRVVRHEVGHLDVLVNNAGIGGDGRFDAPDALDHADRMLALNLRAPIALTHGLLPLLRASRGSIVNVSSVAGLIGTPDAEVYSATKWGLTGFSEALRASLARDGVHVASIHPGPVPTPGWPHERLAASRIGRHVLASTPTAVARACERAARRRGSSAPIRPRTYALIPVLRGLAPWLLRRLLATAARHDVRGHLDKEPTP